MHRNPTHDTISFAARNLMREAAEISDEGLGVCERIREILMICAREDPVYEQISSFSIALYAIGYFDCPDVMSFQDVDSQEAALILSEEFSPVRPEDLPRDFNITQSDERFLLVIGDPLFPLHFAVLVDTRSEQPYFSKLPLFGSGFDSLSELKEEFSGYDGVSRHEISFFRQNRDTDRALSLQRGKIYIVKD